MGMYRFGKLSAASSASMAPFCSQFTAAVSRKARVVEKKRWLGFKWSWLNLKKTFWSRPQQMTHLQECIHHISSPWVHLPHVIPLSLPTFLLESHHLTHISKHGLGDKWELHELEPFKQWLKFLFLSTLHSSCCFDGPVAKCCLIKYFSYSWVMSL